MKAACPISFEMVDEKVSRQNSIVVFVLLGAFCMTQNIWIVAFLVLDFFLRAIKKPLLSPIAQFNRNLNHMIGRKEKLINAGPKIFAARIGLLFSLLVFTFHATEYIIAGNIVAGVFIAAVGLEAFFGFCAACKMYPYLVAAQAYGKEKRWKSFMGSDI